jgi:hypothetical protein
MHENKPPNKNAKEVKFTIENSTRDNKVDTRDLITGNGGVNFYVISGRKYIPFIGRDDNLPFLLLQARLNSTTHNACITSIAQCAIGKGLAVLEQENPNPDFISWTANVNNVEKTLNEVLKRVADGERGFGNQFIELKRGSVGKQKFLKIKLHNIQYCRLGEPNDDDVPTFAFVTKLFARKGITQKEALKKARQIPLWSGNILDKNSVWVKNDDDTESTMLHFKNDVSGIDYYGLPASFSSYIDQLLENSYSQFDKDNLDNNMILGGLIVFKSSMTKEEAQAQAQEILMTHTGEGKTGRIAVISSENGIDDFEFTPYTTTKEGSFIESDKKAKGKIIEAHGWDSLLAGTDSAGAMSKGSGYVRAIWDVKESLVLNPLRDRIIENVVIPIVAIWAEVFGNKEVLKYKFGFSSSMPISFMGDLDPSTFIKVKEARQLGGFEPDDKNGQKYLSEMKQKTTDVQSSGPAPQGANNNG